MPPQSHNHNISKTDFENWLVKLLDTDKPPSLRKVAAYGALSKSTLAYQLKNNAVDPSAILSIARGLGKNPVQELGVFRQFAFLNQARKTPATDTEVIYALAIPDILREVLQRYAKPTEPFSLTDVSSAQVWARWFRACAPSVSGKDIQAVTGISLTSVAHNQQLGSWNIDQVFKLSKSFGLHTLVALITSGFISWAEAGYPDNAIEQQVRNVPVDLLAECLSSIAPKLPQDLGLHRDNRLRNISHEYLA